MYFLCKKAILAAVKYFCIALIWIMSAVIFAGVLCRFVLLLPLVWAEELSLTCMVWLTFVGSALAYELNSHVVVDFVAAKLQGKGRLWLKAATNLMITPLAAVLILAGYTMMEKTKRSITPGMNISVAILYTSAFTGGLLMLWLNLEKVVYSIRSLLAGREILPPISVLPPEAFSKDEPASAAIADGGKN